jgi:hypothetical protein
MASERSLARDRLVTGLRLAVLGLLGGLCFALSVATFLGIAERGAVGLDWTFYRDTGARILGGGPVYLPHQLAGPYDVRLMVDNLYPPTAIPLLLLALAGPIVWWSVPLAVLGYAVWRWRPASWGVTVALLLLAWPRAHAAFIYGNTDIWAAAAVAGGLAWGWPAALLTIKPVFAFLALVGIRRRSWWVVMGALAVGSLLAWPLWVEYATVVRNVRLSPDYSLGSVPLLVAPLVLWVARSAEVG